MSEGQPKKDYTGSIIYGFKLKMRTKANGEQFATYTTLDAEGHQIELKFNTKKAKLIAAGDPAGEKMSDYFVTRTNSPVAAPRTGNVPGSGFQTFPAPAQQPQQAPAMAPIMPNQGYPAPQPAYYPPQQAPYQQQQYQFPNQTQPVPAPNGYGAPGIPF
jgi:hypothetical protein